MKAAKVIAIATLLAVGAAFALEGAALSAASQKEAGKTTVRIFLKSVKVSETNKDGQAWDINNGKPDLIVRIKNDSDTTIKEWSSVEKSDVFEATWDVASIKAATGEKITFTVVDKDLAADDLIGKTTVTLTADMITKGRHEMKFDQVLSLVVEFKKE